MSIDVRVAHINVHQPATDAVRKYNIEGVVNFVKAGGVGTLNEIGKAADHKFIASLASQGIGSFVYGELGILWDTKRFVKLSADAYKIMTGGHVGADGTRVGPDNRRVGPSRYVIAVALKDKTTGIAFVVSTTHLVARAWSVAKWRQRIFWASVKVAGMRLQALTKKYPNGLLNGDMNYNGAKLNWPYLAETQLPLLRTMGNQKYDRAFVWGNVKVIKAPTTFVRKSDHKGFTYVIRVGDGPATGVPPISSTGGGTIAPHPKPTRKNQPPVAHPWAPRTRRWKRRHPILWRRIVRWRRNHPRK